jgi:hypothetical protein
VGMEATGCARWFEPLMAELDFELWITESGELIALDKTMNADANGCVPTVRS